MKFHKASFSAFCSCFFCNSVTLVTFYIPPFWTHSVGWLRVWILCQPHPVGEEDSHSARLWTWSHQLGRMVTGQASYTEPTQWYVQIDFSETSVTATGTEGWGTGHWRQECLWNWIRFKIWTAVVDCVSWMLYSLAIARLYRKSLTLICRPV